ncbi:ead/Ea22-like family protein [Enterobacter cloacae]|uniref:ead/Ea22-like family protein n=1 Tax=Enterobacter cloacae TaxID=550 RepID=UPI002075D100|nr:ead/Ea22-like family protein [Enterobacter cloacae]MCM7495353.1 ead/Ea22-like family protein [Enterobacter cloacae]
MSNIDKHALREAANAANAASWGNWEPYKPHKGARGYEVKVGVKAVAQHCLKVDSVFIAAANPATVLALLDKLEAAEKRIAELEGREVVLPSAHDVHPLGPQSAKIFCEFHRCIVNRCADEIRKVGVKVSIKGN